MSPYWKAPISKRPLQRASPRFYQARVHPDGYPPSACALQRPESWAAGGDPAWRLRVQLPGWMDRSEEHTSELQSLMRSSYAVFCLKKKNQNKQIKVRSEHNHVV